MDLAMTYGGLKRRPFLEKSSSIFFYPLTKRTKRCPPRFTPEVKPVVDLNTSFTRNSLLLLNKVFMLAADLCSDLNIFHHL